jgi:hypothetical protein
VRLEHQLPILHRELEHHLRHLDDVQASLAAVK